jgi:putative transposase
VLGQSPARQKGGPGAAEATGRNPTDRGKSGTKRHVLTEGKGVPIGCIISEANRTDMKKLADLLDACVIEMPVLPADAPDEERPQLCLDRGYDYAACWETARAHGYVPHIPRRATKAQPLPAPEHPDRHPPRRWVVEVAHSWFNRFRGLLIRWAKKAQNYLALVQLAAVLIIYRKLRHARLLPG